MFTREECTNIIEHCLSVEEKHSSTLFNNSDIDYFYIVLKRNDNTQWIFNRIQSFLLDEYPDNKADKMPEVYIHRYPKGSEFARHRDDIKYPDQVLNVGCLLSDKFSGGEFVLHKPFTILPKRIGELYCIKANREHEVYRINSGERWSLILFFTMKDLTKTSLV